MDKYIPNNILRNIHITNKSNDNKIYSIVYLIDCKIGMSFFPDKYFDIAICDPPYGINADILQNKTAKSRIKAAGKNKSGRGWKLYKETEWDNKIPDKNYFEELFRVSKNQIIWGGNYMTEYLPPKSGWIVWNKMQRDFSLSDGELAWTSFDRALRIFDYSRGESLIDNKKFCNNKFHPTAKPIRLYDWIIANYCNKGDKILDTHIGSQSIRISADKSEMDLIGFEIDEDYFKQGNERFEIFKRQLRFNF